jgi:hypothetical protein
MDLCQLKLLRQNLWFTSLGISIALSDIFFFSFFDVILELFLVAFLMLVTVRGNFLLILVCFRNVIVICQRWLYSFGVYF